MVQRDYLLRMIEQFMQAIGRILGFVKTGRFDEARAELDAAYSSLGTSRRMVARLDDGSLRLLFGGEKLRVVGMLLDAEAKLLRAEGKEAEARLLEVRIQRLGVDLGEEPKPAS
jgi:hypothetical protein